MSHAPPYLKMAPRAGLPGMSDFKKLCCQNALTAIMGAKDILQRRQTFAAMSRLPMSAYHPKATVIADIAEGPFSANARRTVPATLAI